MGFGAIIKLLSGNECGGNSNSDKGKMIKAVWVAMKKFFTLDKAKMPGTTKEYDISGSGYEKDDCAQADKGDFPKGAFGTFPIYLTPTYADSTGKTVGAKSGKCYATATPTKYIVYQADAYRRCAWANKK